MSGQNQLLKSFTPSRNINEMPEDWESTVAGHPLPSCS